MSDLHGLFPWSQTPTIPMFLEMNISQTRHIFRSTPNFFSEQFHQIQLNFEKQSQCLLVEAPILGFNFPRDVFPTFPRLRFLEKGIRSFTNACGSRKWFNDAAPRRGIFVGFDDGWWLPMVTSQSMGDFWPVTWVPFFGNWNPKFWWLSCGRAVAKSSYHQLKTVVFRSYKLYRVEKASQSPVENSGV